MQIIGINLLGVYDKGYCEQDRCPQCWYHLYRQRHNAADTTIAAAELALPTSHIASLRI